jgi:hypothetical protein
MDVDERDPDGDLRRRAEGGCAASAALLAAASGEIDPAREAEIDRVRSAPGELVPHDQVVARIAARADAAE